MSKLLLALDDYERLSGKKFADGLSLEEWNQLHPADPNPRAGMTATRKRLLQQRGAACERCGSTERLEIHHLQRVIDGGDNSDGNLIILCHACHLKERTKGAR